MSSFRAAIVVASLCAATSGVHLDAGDQFADVVPVAEDDSLWTVVSNTRDYVIRRTDGGGTSVPADIANVPDILQLSYGLWYPADPVRDRVAPFDQFVGAYQVDGDHLRIDIIFDGLINPPGPVVDWYDPTRYGDSPLYGFLEFDMDNNVDTGGEIADPLFRYNGMVARLGGRPAGEVFEERIAIDGFPIDDDFYTPPWVDRSGEDFHLVFSGEEIDCIVDNVDGVDPPCIPDPVFTPGSVWDVHGFFFRRAHGYADFTLDSWYEPYVRLRFAHHLERDVTVVTFVYPLTQEGYARANDLDPGDPPPIDTDPYNGNSIYEGLYLLHYSASVPINPGLPYWPIIADWAVQDPLDYLLPQNWRLTVLVESALATEPAGPDGGIYIATEVLPALVQGDYNGDGLRTRTDKTLVEEFIALYDGDALYDDGPPGDGAVTVPDFGPNFYMHDFDYDGVVDLNDAEASQQDASDYDNDHDVDLVDFVAFQRCFCETPLDPFLLENVGCLDAFDVDGDLDIDLDDFAHEDGVSVLLVGPDGDVSDP